MKNIDNYTFIVFAHFIHSFSLNTLEPNTTEIMCSIAMEMILRGNY